MNNYLTTLAKYLLLQEPKQGISKVRLAKFIYFAHKTLVQQKLADISDLGFIRMPLGPVPQGFNELTDDSSITMGQEATGLSYNKQVFRYDGSANTNDSTYRIVRNVYAQLHNLPTSVLVEASHKEPSWQNHVNGEEYFIAKEDLRIPLPTFQDSQMTQERDNQLLQARLVEGMLDDIVEESTRLEYPAKS